MFCKDNSNHAAFFSGARGLVSILACFFVSSAQLAFAQGGLLEEVIVTAQKREQSAQDVGIAITAFSGTQLNQLGIVNNTELARFHTRCLYLWPGRRRPAAIYDSRGNSK